MAQLSQISSYFAENISTTCHHVILPQGYADALGLTVLHAVLYRQSENGSILVARDPTDELTLQLWDTQQLHSFSVEYFPLIFMKFEIKTAFDVPVYQKTVFEFTSVRAAKRAFSLVEEMVKETRTLNDLYQKREVGARDGNGLSAIYYESVKPQASGNLISRRVFPSQINAERRASHRPHSTPDLAISISPLPERRLGSGMSFPPPRRLHPHMSRAVGHVSPVQSRPLPRPRLHTTSVPPRDVIRPGFLVPK
ncbi:uncharacterized protein LOC134177343 [Corticium candelabrum]|uniref:uncharacterized protein LOC134177343 n=1 Tax=Corticium candelabrum TaxID=121492 RepID=UPI002E2764B3|nr:uncharacterized protein LOC134177343 [Corticium candelabrum]